MSLDWFRNFFLDIPNRFCYYLYLAAFGGLFFAQTMPPTPKGTFFWLKLKDKLKKPPAHSAGGFLM